MSQFLLSSAFIMRDDYGMGFETMLKNMVLKLNYIEKLISTWVLLSIFLTVSLQP